MASPLNRDEHWPSVAIGDDDQSGLAGVVPR